MNILHSIEAHFGFTYPPLYHQLYADGMLSYGAQGAALLSSPPLLFWADFELVLPEQVIAEHEEFYSPVNYRKVPAGMVLVPFGMDGGGDLFCFNITKVKEGEIPIVLAAHDSSKVETLAENLQDFIYRSLIEMVENLDTESGIVANLRTNLDNTLETHGRYLTGMQVQGVVHAFNNVA